MFSIMVISRLLTPACSMRPTEAVEAVVLRDCVWGGVTVYAFSLGALLCSLPTTHALEPAQLPPGSQGSHAAGSGWAVEGVVRPHSLTQNHRVCVQRLPERELDWTMVPTGKGEPGVVQETQGGPPPAG